MSLLHRSLPLLRFRPLNLREIDLRPIVHKTKIRTFKNCCAFHAAKPPVFHHLMRPRVSAARALVPIPLYRRWLAFDQRSSAASAESVCDWTVALADVAFVELCHCSPRSNLFSRVNWRVSCEPQARQQTSGVTFFACNATAPHSQHLRHCRRGTAARISCICGFAKSRSSGKFIPSIGRIPPFCSLRECDRCILLANTAATPQHHRPGT